MIDTTHVGDDATIRTGVGLDSLTIGTERSVWIGDRLTVDASLERDTVVVEIFDTEASRLFVIAGSGNDNDEVCVFNSMFSAGTTLNGGSGDADAVGENLLAPTVINFEEIAIC
jgi:hypothetical protein